MVNVTIYTIHGSYGILHVSENTLTATSIHLINFTRSSVGKWKVSHSRAILSPDFTWFHLISPDFTWFHLISPDFTWFHLISPDFTWFHLISPDSSHRLWWIRCPVLSGSSCISSARLHFCGRASRYMSPWIERVLGAHDALLPDWVRRRSEGVLHKTFTIVVCVTYIHLPFLSISYSF